MQLKSTSEVREIARSIAQITGSMTRPEIEQMMDRLDLSRSEHRMIRVCLVAELERRDEMFAALYVAPVKRSGPSVVARAFRWVLGRVRGLMGVGMAQK